MMTESGSESTYPRLSTHILLGDHLRERSPSDWLLPDGSCGCALGGAFLSAGGTKYMEKNTGYPFAIVCLWRWLDKEAPKNPEPVDYRLFDLSLFLPLGAYGPLTSGDIQAGSRVTFLWAISDLFMLVCNGHLTIESLADQVRVWEDEYDDELRATLSHPSALTQSHQSDNLRQGAGDLAAGSGLSFQPELVRSAR